VNAVPAAASLTETTVAPMVEEADTVVDISHVDVTTAERLALATPSREESAREAMDADTVTVAKVSSATKLFEIPEQHVSPAMNCHQISNILL
jgi:archaellum component FlaD/FlaE